MANCSIRNENDDYMQYIPNIIKSMASAHKGELAMVYWRVIFM